MSVQGFWGLPLLPGHKYSRVISVPFQILMATLADDEQQETKSSLHIIVDQKELVLCNLIPGKIEQQQLNVQLIEGEEVTLFVKGESTIHLTGNYIFDNTFIKNIRSFSPISEDIDKEKINVQINNQKASDQLVGNKRISNPINAIRINSNSNSTGIIIRDKIETNESDDDNDDNDNKHKKKSPSKTKRINDDGDKDENNKKSKKAKHTLKGKQSEQPGQELEKNQSSTISVIDKAETHSQATAGKKNEIKKSKNNDKDDKNYKKNDNKKTDTKGKRKSNVILTNNQLQSTASISYTDEPPTPPPHSPNTIPLTDNLEEFRMNIPSLFTPLGLNESLPYIRTENTLHEEDDDDNNDNGNDYRNDSTTDNQTQDNIKHLPNGLIVEDKKVGTGRSAKSRDRVGLRYLGKVSKNDRVFDKNTNGKPFRFTLGDRNAIRGLDIGVTGMKVGGERKLTIPANLAYGKRGMPPDIPPNSELIFIVKMVDLKFNE